MAVKLFLTSRPLPMLCVVCVLREDMTKWLSFLRLHGSATFSFTTGAAVAAAAQLLISTDRWTCVNMARDPFSYATDLPLMFDNAVSMVSAQYAALWSGKEEFHDIAAAKFITTSDNASVRIFDHPMSGDYAIDMQARASIDELIQANR